MKKINPKRIRKLIGLSIVLSLIILKIPQSNSSVIQETEEEFFQGLAKEIREPIISEEETAITSETQEPQYAPGELIVKLREEKTIEEIGELNSKYNVTSIERIFKDTLSPQDLLKQLKDKLSKLSTEHERWYWQLDKDSEEYKEYIEKIEKEKEELTKRIQSQEELISKLEQRQKRAPESITTPNLENIYLLKTEDKDTNILLMAEDYSLNPAVEYAEPNYIAKIQMVPNDPFYHSKGSWGQNYDDLWGLKKIQCEKAWDISQGEGVIVAVIDSGIDYNHEDLKDNIWINSREIPDNGLDDDGNGFVDDVRGWDFIGVAWRTPQEDNDPSDGHGHGTHCAGTIAAVGNNNIGIIGVAPKAKVMAVKGLDDGGYGLLTSLANCLKYAADNGADVLSNSWGGRGSSQLIEKALQYAFNKGCVIVAAAGNSNMDVSYFFPANSLYVIAVAAVDQNDQKCYFSNYGYKIDVAAPGGGIDRNDAYNILSLLAKDSYYSKNLGKYIIDSEYIRLAGTSMACPHVAGLAALIISHKPNYTNFEVCAHIVGTGDNIDSLNPEYKGLLGTRINAYQALTQSLAFPSPKIVYKDYRIDDDNEGESKGNGDGAVIQGETIELYLTLGNIGWGKAEKVNLLFSTTDPDIKIHKNSVYLDQIIAKQKVTLVNPFVFEVSSIIPLFKKIDFNLKITTNEGRYTSDLAFSLIPNLKIEPIAIHPASQEHPAIYEDKIVWQDYRNGESDIYMYDLSTKKETQITTDPKGQWSPAIYEDRIVWQDSRNDNWGIYNWDIYMYDLSTKKEIQITTDPAWQMCSAIYGDRIVWQDNRNSNYDIYMYDLSTKKEIQITTDPAWQGLPAIYGDRIVWTDERNGYFNSDIYMATFVYPDTTPPTTPTVVDEGRYTNSITRLFAKWSSDDLESGIVEYQYRITKDSATGEMIKDWSSAGKDKEVTVTGLNLEDGKTYYFSVKARNGAGLWSKTGFSDGITVDIKPPKGSILINNGAKSTSTPQVTLNLSASDKGSGLDKMQFSNDKVNWSEPEPFSNTKSWTLTKEKGERTVYAKFSDKAGNWSEVVSDTILLTRTGNLEGKVYERKKIRRCRWFWCWWEDTYIPLDNVSIQLTGEGISRATTSDRNGYYHINDLPEGRYTAVASKAGYTSDSKSITITAGRTIKCDFILKKIRNGDLRGRIYEERLICWQWLWWKWCYTSYTPLSNVDIQLTGRGINRSTTSDRYGYYRINDLPEGKYTVTASKAGYTSHSKVITIRERRTTWSSFYLRRH